MVITDGQTDGRTDEQTTCHGKTCARLAGLAASFIVVVIGVLDAGILGLNAFGSEFDQNSVSVSVTAPKRPETYLTYCFGLVSATAKVHWHIYSVSADPLRRNCKIGANCNWTSVTSPLFRLRPKPEKLITVSL